MNTILLSSKCHRIFRTWSDMIPGLCTIIPHGLKPLVPIYTVADLDQTAEKISPSSCFVKLFPGSFSHPFTFGKETNLSD
jgi:hypothetical protein